MSVENEVKEKYDEKIHNIKCCIYFVLGCWGILEAATVTPKSILKIWNSFWATN